jgi:hypothetical protein
MYNVFIKKRRAGVAGIVGGALLMLLTIQAADAQLLRKGNFMPYSTVGLGLGTSSYYGELAPYSRPIVSTFQLIRWHGTANYTRHFTPSFAARASLTYARIVGDDYALNKSGAGFPNFMFARNLHFRNDLKEFAVMGIYKIIPDSRNADRRPQIGPYLFAGLAAVAHNPMARVPALVGNNWVSLQPLGTEGQGNPGYDKPYSLVQLAIPVGFGIRYKLHPKWDVSAEVGFRFTTTDYLDDVSGEYANPALLKSPLAVDMANRVMEPTAARKGGDRINGSTQYLIVDPTYGQPGTLRGSPGLNDAYMLGTIHINYILGSTIKCPPLK